MRRFSPYRLAAYALAVFPNTERPRMALLGMEILRGSEVPFFFRPYVAYKATEKV